MTSERLRAASLTVISWIGSEGFFVLGMEEVNQIIAMPWDPCGAAPARPLHPHRQGDAHELSGRRSPQPLKGHARYQSPAASTADGSLHVAGSPR